VSAKKKRYFQKFREEIVQRALNNEKIQQLLKENSISTRLFNRWKKQYLDGEINSNTNQ